MILALPLTANFVSGHLMLWMFAMLRISTFIMVAPLLNHVAIPKQVKIALALVMSLALMPHLSALHSFKPFTSLSQDIYVFLQQILIGLAMGLILQITFEALNLAGTFTATSMQLNFATAFDASTHSQENILGKFYYVLGMLVFLSLNGPIILLSLISNSFDYLPISAHLLSLSQLKDIPKYTGYMFEFSMTLAMPVMCTLLIINLALAVTTKLSPSMNIFSIGFPITMVIGLATLVYSLPFAMTHFDDIIHQAVVYLIHWQKG